MALLRLRDFYAKIRHTSEELTYKNNSARKFSHYHCNFWREMMTFF